jgi:hypothetical protein
MLATKSHPAIGLKDEDNITVFFQTNSEIPNREIFPSASP